MTVKNKAKQVKPAKRHKTNMFVCAVTGHETYKPDEESLAVRLTVETVQGPAWRCLRCGDYVLGEPKLSGPADEAPEIPRGKLLRDLWIMRGLALEKTIKTFFLLLFAVAVFRFQGMQSSFQSILNEELPLLRPAADAIGWNIDNSWIVKTAETVAETPHVVLPWLAWGLVLYGLVELAEAVGLFLARRWGEYFAVVATSFLIPLEVYEIFHHNTWFKVVALAVNLFLVAWLVVSKRLFGVRGGHAAYMAEHHEESLLTVERAALNGK